MSVSKNTKIVVFFPGIGYHCDKPLLYYTKKLAAKKGYELQEVPYGGFETGIKGLPEKMFKAYEDALSQAENILKDVEWDKYTDVLFVSKSIGTAVAASYAAKHGIKTKNVFFTPVEQSLDVMRDEGIIFTGTKDPWVRESIIPEKCKEMGYPVYVIDDGNHSLETGDAIKDIENLQKIMQEVLSYV